MENLFDTANYPTQEPDTLIVGDRFVWRRPDLASVYDPSSFVLTYNFNEDSGGSNKFSITASETSTDYIIEVNSATTRDYVAGEYNWTAYITRSSDSNRFSVDTGHTTLEINLANSSADNRSHVKKVLDGIEAVLENRASQDQMSYSIAGRSLSRMSIDDLLTFRARYRAEYLKELKLKRIKNKQDTGNTIKVRF